MSNIPYFSAFDLAYYAVYRRKPPGTNIKLIDPPTVETKEFNGMIVETVLEDQWLQSLCSIQNPNMRIISISAGRSRLYLAHIVFLITNINDTKANELVTKFDPHNVMASFARHTDNSKFIGVATRNWYRYGTTYNNKWRSWWENIPEIIEQVVTGK